MKGREGKYGVRRLHEVAIRPEGCSDRNGSGIWGLRTSTWHVHEGGPCARVLDVTGHPSILEHA
jgi:hypothetical protein